LSSQRNGRERKLRSSTGGRLDSGHGVRVNAQEARDGGGRDGRRDVTCTQEQNLLVTARLAEQRLSKTNNRKRKQRQKRQESSLFSSVLGANHMSQFLGSCLSKQTIDMPVNTHPACSSVCDRLVLCTQARKPPFSRSIDGLEGIQNSHPLRFHHYHLLQKKDEMCIYYY
jgi:hypothetical protein